MSIFDSMGRFVGRTARRFTQRDIGEPQTAGLKNLHREFAGHPAKGLTPAKLASILLAAEQGDMIAQYELFDDMEERDAHLLAEMGKRRRAVAGLPWNIEPPSNPSAREKRNAKALTELVQSIPDFNQLLFDVTDAIGKGFACLEFDGWERIDGLWAPRAAIHRPQTWFKLPRGFRQEIRLRDNSADGVPLQPLGWITHVHKAKSGYIERSALFRTLVWPYLFKTYSLSDLMEFLEIYGIPMRIGKYPAGTGPDEKATLFRALLSIGRNAAGIIPSAMQIDFEDAAKGDAAPFEAMLDWAERSESKAILGATLTSQADRGSNTNALGNVHDEVRKDLRDSDAIQVAQTITRDLVLAIASLNGMAPDGARRCPQFIFDPSETEDLKTYAEALPPLIASGMRIPRAWAQSQLGIPEPDGDEELLSSPAAALAPGLGQGLGQVAMRGHVHTAACKANSDAARAQDDFIANLVDQLAERAGPITDQWVAAIRREVMAASSFDDLLDRLSRLQSDLPLDELGSLIEQASGVAHSAGASDAQDQSSA